ncbi:serine/arginine repetitive matrix protein 1-like [Odontomachus brunneus]|uniref:serine/arginine repetitive matrix protein 1-like n=1 Tax=Odontomachus brunneus TaxID=486640 RepID=UPI0013F188B5|nr:serine/arginine repetitive matrix protein 1-like [Odontomachus brunneus]
MQENLKPQRGRLQGEAKESRRQCLSAQLLDLFGPNSEDDQTATPVDSATTLPILPWSSLPATPSPMKVLRTPSPRKQPRPRTSPPRTFSPLKRLPGTTVVVPPQPPSHTKALRVECQAALQRISTSDTPAAKSRDSAGHSVESLLLWTLHRISLAPYVTPPRRLPSPQRPRQVVDKATQPSPETTKNGTPKKPVRPTQRKDFSRRSKPYSHQSTSSAAISPSEFSLQGKSYTPLQGAEDTLKLLQERPQGEAKGTYRQLLSIQLRDLFGTDNEDDRTEEPVELSRSCLAGVHVLIASDVLANTPATDAVATDATTTERGTSQDAIVGRLRRAALAASHPPAVIHTEASKVTASQHRATGTSTPEKTRDSGGYFAESFRPWNLLVLSLSPSRTRPSLDQLATWDVRARSPLSPRYTVPVLRSPLPPPSRQTADKATQTSPSDTRTTSPRKPAQPPGAVGHRRSPRKLAQSEKFRAHNRSPKKPARPSRPPYTDSALVWNITLMLQINKFTH